MKGFPRFLYIALSVAFLTSCSTHPAKSSTNSNTKTDTVSVASKPDVSVIIDKTINTNSRNKLNDVALYLAGMKPDSFIAIPAKLQNLKSYKQYCDTMDAGFASIEKNRLSKMREWAKTELTQELTAPKTVLYPFSGPDILHCVQFFPEADQYIMIALERYGSLPVMDKMDSTRTLHTLDYVHQSLEDIIGKSYFITRKMAVNVSNQYNGFTPLSHLGPYGRGDDTGGFWRANAAGICYESGLNLVGRVPVVGRNLSLWRGYCRDDFWLSIGSAVFGCHGGPVKWLHFVRHLERHPSLPDYPACGSGAGTICFCCHPVFLYLADFDGTESA